MQGKLNSDAAGFDEVRAHAAYTSPESLNFFGNPKEHPVTAASDLWSVGCLVLELLVGQPVFVQPHELDEPHQQLSQKVLRRHTYWVRSCLQPCLLCCSCVGTTASLHAFPCMLPCPTKKGMCHVTSGEHAPPLISSLSVLFCMQKVPSSWTDCSVVYVGFLSVAAISGSPTPTGCHHFAIP